MKITRSKITIVLMLFMVLSLALPTLAKMPDRGEMGPQISLPQEQAPDAPADVPAPSEALAEAEPVSAVEPQWVPSSAVPGFYAVRDWRNLNAATHGLVGGHQSFYWDQLEPFEGYYDWSAIESFLNMEIAAGKKPGIGIITFNSRDNEGNVADPPIRVPSFVFSAGADKITCPDGFQIPKYWDPIYLAKYENFIAALGARYDGDPRIEFIQIGVGKFGETQPSDDEDDACVQAALSADGLTIWTWGDVIVKSITAIYDRHFDSTMLYLPNAPTFAGDKGGFKKWTDDAIARGIGVFPAGLMPIQEAVDYRSKAGWDGMGKFDQILTHIENFEAGVEAEAWVPISQEAYNYMTPTAVDYYWAVLGALRRRVDHITIEHNLLYDGAAQRPDFAQFVNTMQWATPYMGKSITNAPSAWVAMREAGYADNWYPQKGNYTYWLYQDDAIPGGATRVTTYRPKRDLVHHYDYDTYGEVSTVRATIETGQTFLGGPTGNAKEGWIARRTDQGTGNRYIGLKLDDRYAYGGPTAATVTVTYFDRGTDTWQLIYDAVGNPNKSAGIVTKSNTNTWQQRVFSLSDAAFTNSQIGGTDLRIDCMNDGNEYVHMVDVDASGTGITATPTATIDLSITPTPSSTPTVTLTPSRTSTRTNTPLVTPTPAVVNVNVTQDTYLDSWYPTTSHGTADRLRARTKIFDALLQFDTAFVPTNATVTKATLHLYLDYYVHQAELSPNLSVYKLKQSWLEGEATWLNRLTDTPWAAAGAEGLTDREATAAAVTQITTNSTWYQWDVTALVQDWVYSPSGNKGLMVLSDSGRDLRFHSSDFASNKPYLHIEYNTSGGTAPTATPTVQPSGTPSVSPTRNVSEFRGASKDTFLDQVNPTVNKENQFLHVYGPGWDRTLIDFSISGEVPAGAQIISATLRLTSGYPGDGRTGGLNIGVYKMNRAWVANQATYNLASSGVTWASPGASAIPADREGTPVDVQYVQQVSTGTLPYQRFTYDWDVTSIIQDWANNYTSQYGMMLLDPSGVYRDIYFYDSSYLGASGIELHPLLIVEWQTGGVTPTPNPGASTIQGTVYNDLSEDGTRQAGELGVLGVTVQLRSGGTLVNSQLTNGSGIYTFANVNPGAYTVQVIAPSGYLVSSTNPLAVSASAGTTSYADFGVYQGSSAIYLPAIRK